MLPFAIVGDNIAAILPQQCFECRGAGQCSVLVIVIVTPRGKINTGCPPRNDKPLAMCGLNTALSRYDVT